MKNSKYFIFGIIVSFIIFFIIGIILNFINLNTKIYIKPIDDFDEKLLVLDEKIDKVKSDECRSSLEILSKRIEDTYYSEDIKLSEYYNNYYQDNNEYYNMFLDSLDICKINNDDSIYISDLALASKSFPETVKVRYKTNYEFLFRDYINYKNTYELSDNLGSYTSKELEINSLSELIDIVLNNETVKKR